MDSELKVHAILVAVNDKNEDILPTAVNENVRDDAYYLWDDAIKCPPECPPNSPLNP
jgi:hypothetical protein